MKRPTAQESDAQVIRINCPLPAHKDEFVLYKRRGWKYAHRRKVDQFLSGDEMVRVLLERVVGWHVLDEDGNAIEFPGYQDPEAAAAAAHDEALAAGRTEDEARIQAGVARVKADAENTQAIDNVPPATATWLLGTFGEAYQAAANPLAARS